MNEETRKLHVYFLPVMAPGHMIPMIDIARHFAKLGIISTIITTPLNALSFSETIQKDRENGSDINISLIKFPCKEAGLPEGCENVSSLPPEMILTFVKALELLQEPVERLLEESDRPHCIVAGASFWWATDIARKLNIPRLVFYGMGFFAMCVVHSLIKYKPHECSDCEEFAVPGLPDHITMSRRQLPEHFMKDQDGNDPLVEIARKILISDSKSYGMIVNSFYELEPAYAEHCKDGMWIKAWHIGPVSLLNQSYEAKTFRGKESAFSDLNCLSWLDTRKPDSVVYVCFGSMAIFSSVELLEIANGLEASGQQFIWVVKEKTKDQMDVEPLLEDFKRRMEGRGLIVTGWAPQVPILDHEAVGGFITHCGWNSLLEGVAGGVPMVTWPLSSEQFFNQKLVTDVLKTGIPVGAQEWTKRTDDRVPIKAENIAKAVARLMVGDEAETIRIRARNLGEMAKKAVEKGGSSDNDLNSLLEELRLYHL